MSSQIVRNSRINKKLFLSIFFIVFTIFLFTSDGHRYSGDEDWQNLQAIRMVTLEPHPLYIDGESRIRFEYPVSYPPQWQGPTCYNYILCSPAKIGDSVTQVPFLFINHTFNIITEDSVTWTTEDFSDLHYVFWRNSINPDFVFLELFYGPFFMALSVSVFFLICRTFNYQIKTSLILSFVLALTTPFWAYSQTSLSTVPFVFVTLLGFYFFRRYQNNSTINLIYCGFCLGFGFMVRAEMALVIIVLGIFFVYTLRGKTGKIKNIIFYFVPQIFLFLIYRMLQNLSNGPPNSEQAIPEVGGGIATSLLPFIHNGNFIPLERFVTGELGLLISPGVGLLFFAPILFTIFFSFPDFFKNHKGETIFVLGFITLFVIYLGSFQHWHGLVSWGTRYLIPCIPFLLLPLGASIESKNFKKIMIIIVVLGSFGFLANLAHASIDVSWFVWAQPGYEKGLFSLGNVMTELYIHPATIWTFEYSQLTNTIIMFLTGFQADIFLLKLMGSGTFAGVIISLLSSQVYFIYRILNNAKKTETANKNTLEFSS